MDAIHAGLTPVLWWASAILVVLAAALATVVLRQRREIRSLHQDESRLRFALRVSDVGVFDHDHRSGEIYRSPEFCRLYGLESDGPATKRDLVDAVHPDERDVIARAIERAHDPAGQGSFNVQHRIILPDGAIRWLELRSLTLFEGEGASRRAVRTVGTAMDCTARRTIDEALHQVVRITRIGIFDHDHENERIYWSDELREDYGFSRMNR